MGCGLSDGGSRRGGGDGGHYGEKHGSRVVGRGDSVAGQSHPSQAKPSVSDESKQAIGITVADSTRTHVGVPTIAPTAMVEQTNRLQHTINFADSTMPTSKAKPAGVRGAQVWVKVGTAPPARDFRSLKDFGSLELQYLATDTRTPYVAEYDPADAGKTAYYWLRWENTKGQPGPWSATALATITG